MNRAWSLGPYRVVEQAGTWYIYVGRGGVVFQGDADGVIAYLRNRGYELGEEASR